VSIDRDEEEERNVRVEGVLTEIRRIRERADKHLNAARQSAERTHRKLDRLEKAVRQSRRKKS